ncbi:hypothetical protein [Treponema saccharophilum]|uniref:Uncharacterized protein n=1 Tax=Treponema saccharophilum DSM 2985 TaxID=907348 RepID=H7EJY4_9SPIR|nr:hypothetical protein [Treponema saccharophilum]EIC02071.1 hypothetical protein TresaDRAFT_1407 [Treponema saccharophilum DSM 2985]BDC96261.1 hypothetical protein TRSA_13600 [Treponema saccharophilum]
MDFSDIPEGHADGEEPLVFHYSRERRLEHAPQIVRDYYDGKLTAFRPGLFKALVATKANRFMLFALVLCFCVVLFNAFFGPKENAETYRGIPLVLKTFRFAESSAGEVFAVVEVGDAEKRYADSYGNGNEVVITAKFRFLDVDNQIVLDEAEKTAVYSGGKMSLGVKAQDFELSSVEALILLRNAGIDASVSLRSKISR